MNWEIFHSCVESILSGCTHFGQEQDRVESRSRPSEKCKHSRARSCLTVSSQRWLFTELCASGINNNESGAFFRRYDQYISKLSPDIRILSLRNVQSLKLVAQYWMYVYLLWEDPLLKLLRKNILISFGGNIKYNTRNFLSDGLRSERTTGSSVLTFSVSHAVIFAQSSLFWT